MRWLWESCNLISEEASLFRVCTQTQTATHGFMLIVWICPLPVTMLYPTQPHRGTVAHAVFRTSLPAYLILFRVIQATPQLLLVIHSTTWSDVPIHTATPLSTSSPSKPTATLPANSIRILILNFFILPPRRNSSVMHLTLVILMLHWAARHGWSLPCPIQRFPPGWGNIYRKDGKTTMVGY